jgi:hypothetical protein
MNGMIVAKPAAGDACAELAARISEALLRERIVPRFVDSYVIEHGRQGLQVHAALYRDLLSLLQREALIAMSVHAVEKVTQTELKAMGKGKPRMMSKSEATAFRRKFLAALARQQKWSVGEALDFQKDFQIYEELIAGSGSRRRKPFEAANHPFVDRCAFLLDSSFLEKARVAASRALNELEALADQVVASTSAENSRGKSTPKG